MKEIAFSLVINLFNFYSGILVYRFILYKSNKVFYKILVTSIFFRYVINLFFIWVGFKLLEFNVLILGLSYLFSVFIAILAEVVYINKKWKLLNL